MLDNSFANPYAIRLVLSIYHLTSLKILITCLSESLEPYHTWSTSSTATVVSTTSYQRCKRSVRLLIRKMESGIWINGCTIIRVISDKVIGMTDERCLKGTRTSDASTSRQQSPRRQETTRLQLMLLSKWGVWVLARKYAKLLLSLKLEHEIYFLKH